MISARISTREVLPGEAICREGSPAGEWYLLAEGKARVSHTRPDGGQEVISFLGAGAVFGVVGLLDGGARENTVAALQPGICLVFPRSLLEEDSRLTLCMGELLCMALNHQLRAVNQCLLRMARVSSGGPEGGGRTFGGWMPPSERL